MGAIIKIGINLAILGSKSISINPLISNVLITHQKTRFIKYLNPDFE
jgi:hypothetical protein